LRTEDASQEISGRLCRGIRALRTKFDGLSACFRQGFTAGGDPHFDKLSADSVRRNTYGDALIRLRQLTDNNFQFIETLGLLAVARYVFELSVWLLLFDKDPR